MLRLKDKSELNLSAVLLCMIDKCNEEGTRLWSTESNVIDICERHYKQLIDEAFIS